MDEEKEVKHSRWRRELCEYEERRHDDEPVDGEDGGQPTRLDYEAECGQLLRSNDILGRVAEILRDAGSFAGGTLVVALLVLALYSRHLAKPVSIAVRGESSSGKSYAIERALGFASPEAAHVLTSMSEKVLAFSEEEYAHRVIIVYEADALENKKTAALVRSLLSEGKLVHEYTDFEGGRRSVKIVKDGPTGLITSSAGRIDYELGTRLFSVNVDDGPDATKSILASLARAAEGKTTEPDLTEFHALDRWISTGERRVVVPFAGQIAVFCDATATRMRRDFQAVLGLVQAHALLHRSWRERDPHGRIAATLEDYAAVYKLVDDVLAYSSGHAIPMPIRETVEAVDYLQHETGVPGESVKLAEIAAHLGLHRTSVGRRVRGAVKLDLLQEVDRKGGGPILIKLGEPLPEDRGVLPSPDDLGMEP